MKVLVVDDSADAAQSVVMLLETLGHDARTAPDGTGAMKTALEFVPDLILMDIGLPGVDGLQVAKWIRDQPTLKQAVLIAVTGYGQQSDRQRSLDAGFDQHWVKPVDFARLESILCAAASKAG
jgi:CheY-like chemotaxis protein